MIAHPLQTHNTRTDQSHARHDQKRPNHTAGGMNHAGLTSWQTSHLPAGRKSLVVPHPPTLHPEPRGPSATRSRWTLAPPPCPPWPSRGWCSEQLATQGLATRSCKLVYVCPRGRWFWDPRPVMVHVIIMKGWEAKWSNAWKAFFHNYVNLGILY